VQYTTLGRTGLKVSVAGLGCGGNSRIGLGKIPEADSIALVRTAIDLGVNFIDTAENYETEPIVGKAIKGLPRDSVVISTKSLLVKDGQPKSGAAMVASLDASLRKLGTDYVDIFHLHGLSPNAYDRALSEVVPALLREKEKGKFRHLAVSETGPRDPEHMMLSRAVDEPLFEVIMLAFHMLNQNARTPVLEKARVNRIGTLCMFAVRNIFSRPGLLQETIATLAAEGKLPAALVKERNPLGFLVHAGGADSLVEAAYRFARHEPGIDVVLFGTGSIDHLRANIASILRPPLPAADVARLNQMFGHLVGVGLDLPDHITAKPAPKT
jgi:aryl-alcohol dehydrogenase-like predicted oxidoreductase